MSVSQVPRLLSAFLLVLGLIGLVHGTVQAQESGPVYVATVEGVINPVQASYVKRVIDQAEQQGAQAVVLQLDTPGGLDTSMREIIQRILASRVPVIVYVGPPGARAGSAGVYITYAAHVAAMAPNTNIGSATPVAVGEGGEVRLSDEMKAKVTNDAVAYIKGLAERRGRNVEWAERAVREGVSATSNEAVEQGIVDLNAPDLPQLMASLEGRSIETVAGTVVLHTAAAAVESSEMNPLERFLHAISDPTIAYLLLSLGSLGLMLELYNPGQLIPGVVGGLCLLLALYALGTLPVNMAGLLLMAFALLLFVGDVISPTHGILTVGGIIAFVLGSFLLINAPDSAPFLQISVPAIVATTALLTAFFVFVIGAVVRSRHRPSVTGREGLIGALGEVRTRLAPRGFVHVEGELWRAESNGRPVEVGEQVRVIDVAGLLLTVQPGEIVPATASSAAQPSSAARQQVPASGVGR
jgi:membrane-bound serine protease (ClpP class)